MRKTIAALAAALTCLAFLTAPASATASGVPGWPAIPAACAASPARIWWGQNQPNQPLYRENSPGQFCLRSLDTDHNWQTLLYFTTSSHLIVVDCLKGASSCYYVWGSGNILSTRGEILLNYACDLVIYTVAGGTTHTWDYHVSQSAGSRACSATASNASAYIQAHCMPDYYRTIWGRPESRFSIGNC